MTTTQPRIYRRTRDVEELHVMKWTGDNAETLRAWMETDMPDVTYTELCNGALDLFTSSIYVTTVKDGTYLGHDPDMDDSWFGYSKELLNEYYAPTDISLADCATLPDRSVLMVTASTDTMLPVGAVLLLDGAMVRSTHLSGDPLPVARQGNYDVACRIVELGEPA